MSACDAQAGYAEPDPFCHGLLSRGSEVYSGGRCCPAGSAPLDWRRHATSSGLAVQVARAWATAAIPSFLRRLGRSNPIGNRRP